MLDVRTTIYPDGTSVNESVIVHGGMMTDGSLAVWIVREYFDEEGVFVDQEEEFKGYGYLGAYLDVCFRIGVDPDWSIVKDSWTSSRRYNRNPMSRKFKKD